jgi:putative ABC transport system ATP-binding protein
LALTFQGVYGVQRKRLAIDALQRVGLAARAAHRPGQLSGGEQQRAAVARAIAHQPRLLLADEPTGNLDWKTAEEIVGLIRNINRESGMTVMERYQEIGICKAIGASDGDIRILFSHRGRSARRDRRLRRADSRLDRFAAHPVGRQ